MGTERDKNVINLILNPILPFGLETKTNGGEDGNKKEEGEKLSQLPNYEESERLNLEAVNLAEAENYETALVKFDEAIRCCPANPSPYNNRAQLHRLMSNIPAALTDLKRALELCEGKGRTAAQSFVQKALICRLQGDDEKAKEEFEKAAKLGSNFAKNQLVAMNPYAAMCNAMLADLMTKFRRDE